MEVLLCFLLDNVVALDSLTTFFFLFLWWAIDDDPCIILSITWTWFVLDLSYDGMDNTFMQQLILWYLVGMDICREQEYNEIPRLKMAPGLWDKISPESWFFI